MPTPTAALPRHARPLLAAIDWWIPELEENRDRVVRLRKQLFVVLSVLASVNLLVFVGLHEVHHAPGQPRTVGAILGGLVVGLAVLLALLRRGVPFQQCGRLLVAMFTLGLSAVAAVDGGPRSGALLWLLVVPAVASFLLGARAGWASAAAAGGLALALFVADAAGVAFEGTLAPEQARLHWALNFVGVLVFVASVAWLYESPTIRSLRHLSDRLAAANAALRQELAERERAQRHAEDANRAKSVLLDNLSHEFRTPLTAILGAADLLADGANAETRQVLGLIERGAHRLLGTLDGVLELAWVESGGPGETAAPMDVAAVVQAVVARQAAVAARKGLEVRVHAEPAAVCAETHALRRLVEALVDNAVKFTERGRVGVAVRREGAEVVVEVADTGIGIAPDFRPHLFTPFRQASEGHGRRHEGTGVGLAVARGLAQRLGATLGLEDASGGGTLATVRLPAAPRAPAPERRRAAA